MNRGVNGSMNRIVPFVWLRLIAEDANNRSTPLIPTISESLP